MIPPPLIRDWARKLIASEVGTDATATQVGLAPLRVYERLRLQFRAPVGVDAFQALASRALSLTKSQFPGLSSVKLTASGGFHSIGEVEAPPSLGEDSEVGIVLIAQVLRLFIVLLGESATVTLIEHVSVKVDSHLEPDTTETSISAAGTNYFGPFKEILLEADQLRHVSERLESLADTHDNVDELVGVAGSIRNIATALDVFTVVRGKVGDSRDSDLLPLTNGYVN
jgi:hypothetical protein